MRGHAGGLPRAQVPHQDLKLCWAPLAERLCVLLSPPQSLSSAARASRSASLLADFLAGLGVASSCPCLVWPMGAGKRSERG